MRMLGSLAILAVGIAVAPVLGALLLNRLPWTDPPGVGARLRVYLSTNVAETCEHSVFPELRPRHFGLDSKWLYANVREALTRLGWEVVAESADVPKLTAVVTTPVLRFKDDVTIRVERAPGGGCVLHVISRSRVGRADLGANTRHVMDLHASLERVDR
ncbi:MAG: DUF1499 domain-containing protein [Chromatiales bacterium]